MSFNSESRFVRWPGIIKYNKSYIKSCEVVLAILDNKILPYMSSIHYFPLFSYCIKDSCNLLGVECDKECSKCILYNDITQIIKKDKNISEYTLSVYYPVTIDKTDALVESLSNEGYGYEFSSKFMNFLMGLVNKELNSIIRDVLVSHGYKL